MPQEDGSLQWAIDEKFNALTTGLDRIRSTRVVGEDASRTFVFDNDSDFYFLCDVLQVNYRVTPELIAHLRLFSDAAIQEMVASLLGLTLGGG